MRGRGGGPEEGTLELLGLGDGETLQTEGAKGVAKGKEGIWHIQKPSPDGGHTGRVSEEQKEAQRVHRSQTL